MKYELIDLMESYYSLPQTSGVYILIGKDNQVIYIGSSINLRARVYFKRLLEEFLRFSLDHVIIFECFDFKNLERQLIALFRPIANVHIDGQWVNRRPFRMPT